MQIRASSLVNQNIRDIRRRAGWKNKEHENIQKHMPGVWPSVSGKEKTESATTKTHKIDTRSFPQGDFPLFLKKKKKFFKLSLLQLHDLIFFFFLLRSDLFLSLLSFSHPSSLKFFFPLFFLTWLWICLPFYHKRETMCYCAALRWGKEECLFVGSHPCAGEAACSPGCL